MKLKTTIIAAVAGVGLMSSAAYAFWGASKVEAEVRMPAKSTAAAALKRISVVPFSGTDGGAFADIVRGELSTATLDGAQYFTLVNNDALAAFSGASGSSAQTIRTLTTLGKQSGVDAIYYGSVSGGVETQTSQKKKTRCVEYEGFLNCKREEEYTATCYRLVATYTAIPQVVEVATGNIAYTEQISAGSTYDYCNDETANRTPDDLLATARKSVAEKLRQAVAPYNTRIEIEYKSRAQEFRKDKPKDERFRNAAKFAKAGQVDRACAMWGEMAPDDNTEATSLLFNLGVCAEVQGDYQRAVALFSRAESLLSEPDDDIYKALQRARESIKREQTLIKQ